MKHLRRVILKFYLLFSNSKAEAELAREIDSHLTLLEDVNERHHYNPGAQPSGDLWLRAE